MNDDDKKLLLMAAKAIGAKPYDWDTSGTGLFIKDGKPVMLANGDPDGDWNPLADDGDALRLAVKLNLSAKRFGDLIEVVAPKGSSFSIICEQGVLGGDLLTSYRRAIVRAAAEIGKLQP